MAPLIVRAKSSVIYASNTSLSRAAIRLRRAVNHSVKPVEVVGHHA
jgi:hypothetical protein